MNYMSLESYIFQYPHPSLVHCRLLDRQYAATQVYSINDSIFQYIVEIPGNESTTIIGNRANY